MLGDDLVKLLEAASRTIADRAEHDEEVRAALGRIGRWLVDLAERLPENQRVRQAADSESAFDGRAGAASSPDAATSSSGSQPFMQTTLEIEGGSASVAGCSRTEDELPRLTPAQPTITGPRVVSMPSRTHDLRTVEKRSRLKSEACRWAIRRRRRQEEGADFKTAISPTDHEMIERAKALAQCYLWMLDPYGVMPPDDPVLSIIEACYTNLADAAALVLEVQRKQEQQDENSGGPDIEEPVRLLAEAQSALRVSLTNAGLRADQDQIDAFAWLKEFTYAERIYLDQFMRLDSAADPQEWSGLHDRIEQLRDAMDESAARTARRTKLLNRARYHARKLDDGELDDWQKIMLAIAELVEDGVAPSDLEIREILLPILDEIPEEIELSTGAAQAVREVDRYLASREASREAEPPPVREPTKDVLQVASWLRGKTIVLIGGDERAEASRGIERAFELERLRWISAKPHQSISTFEPEVARDETALVMLAIRFSSHSFEGVKAMCDRYGKPFVRLPGGYGVNQIARQILMQVGNRLAGD